MNGHVTIIVYLQKRAVLAHSGNLKMTTCYPPQLLLRQGYVFTGVSLSTGEVYTPWQADTPLAGRQSSGRRPLAGRHPPGRPPQQTATAVDGTHPTGMHSCSLELNFFHVTSVIILNTISKRQDGSDLFRILHTKSFSKFTEASVYYVMHYVVT